MGSGWKGGTGDQAPQPKDPGPAHRWAGPRQHRGRRGGGQCVGVDSWAPKRTQAHAAQSQAARRLFEVMPGARLIYEKPHYQKGRGLHAYGGLMRSIGIFCAWFPYRSTGVTPSEWRRVCGVRGRDLKAAAIRAVGRWLVDMPDLDPTGQLAQAMADNNDHVAEAALIARWFRLEHPNARGTG